MQYSPKLKRVAEQIKKILKDNDVAGVVALHTPGHSEYVNEITPSYSAIEWMKDGEGVWIRGKAEHYGGDKVKRDKKLTDTLNMLNLLSTTVGHQAMNLMQISEQADKIWNAEHDGTGHSSHNEQNN